MSNFTHFYHLIRILCAQSCKIKPREYEKGLNHFNITAKVSLGSLRPRLTSKGTMAQRKRLNSLSKTFTAGFKMLDSWFLSLAKCRGNYHWLQLSVHSTLRKEEICIFGFTRTICRWTHLKMKGRQLEVWKGNCWSKRKSGKKQRKKDKYKQNEWDWHSGRTKAEQRILQTEC